MKLAKIGAAAAALAMLAALPAKAGILFDTTNGVGGGVNNIAFVASAGTTNITFEGYNVPGFDDVLDIGVFLNDAGANLLGLTWAYTPAPSGALASQGGAGAYGTNNLDFAGVTFGSYDAFSQSFASTAGSTYNVRFTYNPDGTNANALRIGTDAGAAPEPASWALMILGVGAAGAMVRSRRKALVAA